ncbi:MAG: metallophosphoesterase [Nanoarchaeota archaeon]|nr:metallophosphoesterase [Nanoarchaeota archaeon]
MERFDNINKKVIFLEDSLIIGNTLVIGDLHLGEKEILPKIYYNEIIEKFERIFNEIKLKKINLDKIVILGDLKHEFGEITNNEWRYVLDIIRYLGKKVKEIVIIKGNHDSLLMPILKKVEIGLKDYFFECGALFLHGDRLIDKKVISKSKIIFLGHLHPALSLSDEYKNEKFKCFLTGIWKNKIAYVLPSFSPVFPGYDLKNKDMHEDKDFFIIDRKFLLKFKVIIYDNKDNKEYNFGKLKELV